MGPLPEASDFVNTDGGIKEVRGVLGWIGRFIANSIAVVLGLAIAIAASPWIVLKTFEVLARIFA